LRHHLSPQISSCEEWIGRCSGATGGNLGKAGGEAMRGAGKAAVTRWLQDRNARHPANLRRCGSASAPNIHLAVHSIIFAPTVIGGLSWPRLCEKSPGCAGSACGSAASSALVENPSRRHCLRVLRPPGAARWRFFRPSALYARTASISLWTPTIAITRFIL
jgi:hypothetical protein